jgi:TRAP-type mannitol/chloroaromatic compound transport system permease small subunit
MPSLTFELPHWVYWTGLLVLPLLAMAAVWRARQRPPRLVSLPVAYLLWLCGGFVGLHRFYVKSLLGLVYIPLFGVILWGNAETFDARTVLSAANDDRIRAEFNVERFGEAAAAGEEGAAERLAEAEQAVIAVQQRVAAATASRDHWRTITGAVGLVIAIFLVIDAFLLPGLVRRQAAREPAPPPLPDLEPEVRPGAEDPVRNVRTPLTDAIDALSGWTGEFVAYWSVIAVFVYYFEVVSRYVFNSPTNWAHESMFLMFGMMYLISGAYALREDAHVRVDVIYVHLSDRAKIITDILTSIFFFIFTVTLLVTGWTFMMDSINVREVSFAEWGIQYWPVKVSIVVGAALITLQGLSKLIKDVVALARLEA